MNKNITEILNYMKQYVENKYEHDSEPMLNWKDLQIVLSYIEQLEKRIYKARKMIFDNYGVLDKYEIEMLDDILKGDSE